MPNPNVNYEQVIEDFERQQAAYQAALEARELAKQNEEVQRQIAFQQQQMLYEEVQKTNRRCERVQKVIDVLSSIIQEVEWGSCTRLNERLRSVESSMSFDINNRMLKDGR